MVPADQTSKAGFRIDRNLSTITGVSIGITGGGARGSCYIDEYEVPQKRDALSE